nr:MAG TPA: hypothetical protein [Caudoviricetes sp.]
MVTFRIIEIFLCFFELLLQFLNLRLSIEVISFSFHPLATWTRA